MIDDFFVPTTRSAAPRSSRPNSAYYGIINRIIRNNGIYDRWLPRVTRLPETMRLNLIVKPPATYYYSPMSSIKDPDFRSAYEGLVQRCVGTLSNISGNFHMEPRDFAPIGFYETIPIATGFEIFLEFESDAVLMSMALGCMTDR